MAKSGRPSGELTHCDKTWTAAKFRSFVKNNLRSTSRKWPPIQQCKKNANVSRGLYKCAGCEQIVPPTIYDEEKRKRVTNIFTDHIIPVIDPEIGFTTWDDCINRLFCDSENLQLLCKKCHSIKCQEEIDITKQRRQKEKEDG